ncbi:TetR/AcrR family transcriptional regulator [Nonomuraea roseoviolacea]|uniref:AcrR family transcriptional regulator n=1 Tax=Nonomuraea roseoviolacea subsp. carminata TaxID=160689 RepID=A0ABT1KC17_9ACTN|nr:TetR/AcrR family transcriptional regulator [Nonomuraea roseoviolacea]MCP2351490.1 AcrR family transcriptional regulator [Nonomuraea roseoviolacea subsp. carminata]
MSQLIEHHSRKAARILDSARELVLDHGVRKVTVSEIAHAAGVGKGTVYLYWAAKEDLILGLFARELLTFLDEIIARVGADPATVLPRRLAPLLVGAGLRLPLASRLKHGDTDLMRTLTRQAADLDVFARLKPSALCEAVMPVLRRHGLIRHDRPLPDQCYAMHALLTGFGTAMSAPATAPLGVEDPYAVLADAVAQLLEPPVAPDGQAVAAAAGATLAVFGRSRDLVLGLIARSQVGGRYLS